MDQIIAAAYPTQNSVWVVAVVVVLLVVFLFPWMAPWWAQQCLYWIVDSHSRHALGFNHFLPLPIKRRPICFDEPKIHPNISDWEASAGCPSSMLLDEIIIAIVSESWTTTSTAAGWTCSGTQLIISEDSGELGVQGHGLWRRAAFSQ